MTSPKTPLSFESADAVSVGGSYTVNTDGRPVRSDATSGPIERVVEQVADGAPGPEAVSFVAASVGVAPAQPKAPGALKA